MMEHISRNNSVAVLVRSMFLGNIQLACKTLKERRCFSAKLKARNSVNSTRVVCGVRNGVECSIQIGGIDSNLTE